MRVTRFAFASSVVGLMMAGAFHVQAQQILFTTPNEVVLNASAATPRNYVLTDGAPAGFLYFPGEPVNLKLALVKADDRPLALEIQGVHTRVPKKDTPQHIDPFGHPGVINLDGEPIRHPIAVAWDELKQTVLKQTLVDLTDVPVPERFGTYVLILLRGEGKERQDRILLGSVARIPAMRKDATADNTPIFGEGNTRAFGALARMGIRGIRHEISWRGSDAAEYDWKEYDTLTASLKEAGLQAMFSLGSVPARRQGITGAPVAIPAAVEPDWKGSVYGGRGDAGCAPEHFPVYEEWVKAFCARYWEDGKGALWGVENYNDPWEGGGVSLYARDMISYRDWQRHLARAARAVSPDIKVCAASSIMNTEDKLFSEGPDENGKYEFDKYIDVFTDHYVSPNMSYGPMVAAKHGKFSIENETWLAINEYVLPQIMCQWLASGQRAVACWHPKALFEQGFPTTVPLATAVFNHFVTGLRFERLVFQEHLPWLFQFGEDDDANAVCVMFGQLLTRGGPTPQDNPKGRLWGQVDSVDGGTITLDNADGALRFYDAAANEVRKGEKSVTLPLNLEPFYVQSKKGPKLVAERFRAGRIEGKYPAEILPRDFTQRISTPELTLRVELANRLNRPITGKLNVTVPEGFELAGNNLSVTLEAGERRTVPVRFAQVAENPDNQYPFDFVFDTDAGRCEYSEVLHATVAVKRTPKIDGDLSDWDGIPGMIVAGKVQGVNEDELARRPWLRLEELPKGTLFAELKMAWDDDYLYVAARVNDATPQDDKVRMETRDDESYFHSAESDQQEPWKTWLEKHAPGQSFAQVPYIYKKKPFDNAYTGDQLQLAFNTTPGYRDLAPVAEVPWGFHAVPDTDYEFSAYLCADGGSELWNLLSPGMPRIHDWPRQPRGRITTNPTPGSRHVVRQDGDTRIYEIAIPRDRIADLKLEAGSTFKLVFFVGNNQGPTATFGANKAVTRENGLTMKPYWSTSPSADVEWALVE